MRVRLLVGLSGPAYSLGPGDEQDFPQSEAIRLIQAGYAVPIEERRAEQAIKPATPEQRDIPPPPPDWDNPRSSSLGRTRRKRG